MSTATSTTNPNPPASGKGLVLYDVAFISPREANTAAPNPWKARYALNFKGVPYHTKWVQMPDITRVRKSLGVPPCRKFADGKDFYTLPILTDSSTGAKIGDSFDIAHYLQTTYADSGAGDLFPPMPEGRLHYQLSGLMASLVPLSDRSDSEIHADYAKFQHNVDWAFSLHAQLVSDGMRFDTELQDAIHAEFARRAGVASFEALTVKGDEARGKLLASLRDTLRDLALLFQSDKESTRGEEGGEKRGPFLLGDQPSHADFIVGGWLRMLSKTLPEKEWEEEVRVWYGGLFGRLHDVLQERFGEVKV
ncbi:hypothetical protein QBC35DRAFT_499843 [Podospora australis]|uniref:GST N-terminal domain-containing protein n=1 Tax=Podospora australis TaxID=1536484 RepID=A0AAN6WRV7_9PEZI|nr:hypothetical protein QBC35DRAFT_499843 [Podospora australis]